MHRNDYNHPKKPKRIEARLGPNFCRKYCIQCPAHNCPASSNNVVCHTSALHSKGNDGAVDGIGARSMKAQRLARHSTVEDGAVDGVGARSMKAQGR